MSNPRTIKLFCPSQSKLIQLVAWDEQRLDVGSIARAFGLDPSTVKLNGHFISRGIDLVSNSVTWRSLLKFFSSKGLSTGKHDGDALIVDGKLCKVGSKRSHNSEDTLDGTSDKIVVAQDINTSQRPSFENITLLKNKKLRDSSCSGEVWRVGDNLIFIIKPNLPWAGYNNSLVNNHHVLKTLFIKTLNKQNMQITIMFFFFLFWLQLVMICELVKMLAACTHLWFLIMMSKRKRENLLGFRVLANSSSVTDLQVVISRMWGRRPSCDCKQQPQLQEKAFDGRSRFTQEVKDK